VDRVCHQISSAPATAAAFGAVFDPTVDTVYLGGGTPTLLDVTHLERLFVTMRQNFRLTADAEITVECAPGTLSAPMLDALLRCGVNRVSLGIQSFIDQESRAVGRLHTRATVLNDLTRLRASGISNLNLDLIAGLPHQTAESWNSSLDDAIACGVPHVSVYMLEVDDDSRLGRELTAGGTRYHAHFVPDEDQITQFYETACLRLENAGIAQYEISNFATVGRQSVHNLKYWTRQPYLGFGVDAHSMLPALSDQVDAVRFASPDALEAYVSGARIEPQFISRTAALEESFFLGLRLSRGINLQQFARDFGESALVPFSTSIDELVSAGLLQRSGSWLKLTPRGRLLSNEVFERFLSPEAASPVR
jgi:oxygen-independent coproporphyrinogen-3 oxidase